MNARSHESDKHAYSTTQEQLCITEHHFKAPQLVLFVFLKAATTQSLLIHSHTGLTMQVLGGN